MLPVPPAGSHWRIHGTPTAPWMWSSEIVWQYDGHPFSGRVTGRHMVSATAGDAYAQLINDETGLCV